MQPFQGKRAFCEMPRSRHSACLLYLGKLLLLLSVSKIADPILTNFVSFFCIFTWQKLWSVGSLEVLFVSFNFFTGSKFFGILIASLNLF